MTPGHTNESSSLIISKDTDICIFTGDCLFINDVGRPDLVQSQGNSMEEMAGILYDSI